MGIVTTSPFRDLVKAKLWLPHISLIQRVRAVYDHGDPSFSSDHEHSLSLSLFMQMNSCTVDEVGMGTFTTSVFRDERRGWL